VLASIALTAHIQGADYHPVPGFPTLYILTHFGENPRKFMPQIGAYWEKTRNLKVVDITSTDSAVFDLHKHLIVGNVRDWHFVKNKLSWSF